MSAADAMKNLTAASHSNFSADASGGNGESDCIRDKSNSENKIDRQPLENNTTENELINEIPSGVSMESASYIESNNNPEETSNNIPLIDEEIIKEYTPKLFSDEQNIQEESETTNSNSNEYNDGNTEQLFDQDTNEDEDFEIPGFLRKQKF